MSIINTLPALQQYKDHVVDRYQNFPYGKYVTILLIRKTESETIFRTEGSGEGLTKEVVRAGITDETRLRRVMISKRKQTAVERRTGRELLRVHNLLKMVEVKKKVYPCALNTNAPCGKCIDCMLYGFAVGGGGAQKSRVMTDDAYSIGPVAQVTGRRTFNATYDNGTMRNPFDGKASSSINEDEYVLPETHFLDMETLKDVTLGELQYVIGNILRSSRYGAMSSRLGRVKNTIAAIVFSDTEIFSNLELTQNVYDLLLPKKDKKENEHQELSFPLSDEAIKLSTKEATDALLKRVIGRVPLIVRDTALDAIIDETIALYREPERVYELLLEIERGYTTETEKA